MIITMLKIQILYSAKFVRVHFFMNGSSWRFRWNNFTHPTSIKSSGAYKPEKSAFYSTFARQRCDDTRLPGWLSAFPLHSQTFKPTQVSFAHTNSQPSQCWRISSKFRPATWKYRQTTTKGRRPHEKDTPPLLILIAAIPKCNKPMNFNHAIMVTWLY